jgi:hypothetical protein
MRQPRNIWPWKWLVFVLSFIAYSVVLFDFGMRYASHEVVKLRKQQRELRTQLTRARDEQRDMEEQNAVLQRSSQIDREAAIGIKNDLAAVESRLLDLRKELELYRGIVAPGDAEPGLRVQRLELTEASNPGRYRFDMTITQVKRDGKTAKGVIEMEVTGVENGNSAIMLFDKLGGDGDKPLSFSFRYFQHFRGEFGLPADFAPHKVLIKLKPRGKKSPPAVSKEFAWPLS